MNQPMATLDAIPQRAAAAWVFDALGVVCEIQPGAVHDLDGDDLLSFTETLETLGRRIDALRVTAATVVARRSDPVFGETGLAQARGYRSGTELLEQVTGAAAATVRRRIRVGEQVEPRQSEIGLPLPALFPQVGDAFRNGLMGIDSADAISKELATAAPRAEVHHLTAAEYALVGQATGRADALGPVRAYAADLIRGQARTWRDALDPDGIEPRATQAKQGRDLWVSRHARGGLHAFGGHTTSDVAAQLLAVFDTVLSPHTAPMFVPDGDDATLDGADSVDTTDVDEAAGSDGSDGVDARPTDTRTPGQKRADVFAAMIRSFLTSENFSVPPAVLITLDGNTYLNGQGTGTISGVDTPVPASMIGQAACDGGTQPVWFTPTGKLQALGTAGRFFTTQQRRAIAARDGDTCLDPNCDIPATASEAHHVIPDRHGGPTHIDNGVLLCWYHHGLADAGLLTITMINGKPRITSPPRHPPT